MSLKFLIKALWIWACCILLIPLALHADNTRFRWHRNFILPNFSSPGGNFDLYTNGYTQTDFMGFYNAPQLTGQINMAQTRSTLGMDVYKYLQFDITYNYISGEFRELQLTIQNNKNFQIMLGQVFANFGLSNNSDTRSLTFLEQPLMNQSFTPNLGEGLFAVWYQEPFAITGAILRPKFATPISGPVPYSYSVEATLSPLHKQRRLLVFGFSDWLQTTDNSHNAEFSTIPEIEAHNAGTLIATPTIQDIDSYNNIDAFVTTLLGSFSFQSEYFTSQINRTTSTRPQLHFDGYYFTTSYYLTGESRTYSASQMGFINVTKPIHRYGAFQLALRVSTLNLNSNGVMGGKETDITAGINWYLFSYFMFQLNYIHAIAYPNSCGDHQIANFVGFRIQISVP